MLIIRKILLATDFSSACTQAYFHALHMARLHQADLVISHVWRADAADGRGESHFRNLLEQIRPVDESIRVSHALLSGDAATELVAYAREHGIDLIVLGRQGRHDTGRDMLGSVTEEVLRSAPCTVLVARFPQGRSAGTRPRRQGRCGVRFAGPVVLRKPSPSEIRRVLLTPTVAPPTRVCRPQPARGRR